ncbi:MAG: hypothetical protein AB1942_08285 [Pseudomonadota bacterium]
MVAPFGGCSDAETAEGGTARPKVQVSLRIQVDGFVSGRSFALQSN